MRKPLRIQKYDGRTDGPTYWFTQQDVELRVRDLKKVKSYRLKLLWNGKGEVKSFHFKFNCF